MALSMHMPQQPFANRYQLLGPSPEESPPDLPEREIYTPTRYRRPRNSRGTKEAKRRRDARRSKRKMAAQMLDEQLSRDIDATLKEINFTTTGLPTPPSSLPSPRHTPSPMQIEFPEPMFLPPLPPSPPQLPPLRFGDLDLTTLSRLVPSDEYFRSSTLMSVPQLPSWCPPLPALMRNRSSAEDMPKFFDLSRLPEPKNSLASPIPKPSPCQGMQLWRGLVDKKSRQSRFFPRPASPLPRVRLPPTVCKLHKEDESLSSPSAPYADAVKKGIPDDPRKATEDFDTPPDDICAQTMPIFEPSAANLWSILAEESPSHSAAINDPYLASFEACNEDTYLTAWQNAITTENHTEPVELDSKEIPYVHGNSLTDDIGDIEASPYTFEHPSMMHMATTTSEPLSILPVGLNELTMDREYEEGVPAGQYCNNKPIDTSVISAEILPVDCVIEAETAAHVHEHSDAHFNSEQSLFHPSTPAPRSAANSLIDLADFLKLGHGEDCWCSGYCYECKPASEITTARMKPELATTDNVTETDKEWMLYISARDNNSLPDLTTEDVSGQESQAQSAASSDWEDLFSDVVQTTPSKSTTSETSGFDDLDEGDWV
ncbi:hypothetical protein LTR78_007122 [Recurvomyces mirabilis]|uniref:Uncharacterized protein n=2 Tax=Recurvomyces mirabilis TaxID=574656 RepID=A0AAE0WJS9_9PEZI|nr:hypothetical protein LTR78_007122 [Recurvomyces mirabilis]